MTSAVLEVSSSSRPASSSRQSAGSQSCRGFTLIELMVVIGIIVLIAGIALPIVSRARKTALRTRMAADLQTISVALDAYKADFGDYPRIAPGFPPTGVTAGVSPNVWGSQLLCWALIGPAGMNPVANPRNGNGANSVDGYDGPGFRIRQQGRQYGPYLPADKFKIKPFYGQPDWLTPARWTVVTDQTKWNWCEAEIMDANDQPILYFPTKPGRTDTSTFYANVDDPTTQKFYMYNLSANDLTHFAGGKSVVQVMLGDRNNNGFIDNGEAPATTFPYILWSAGPDGVFGPTSATPATPTANDIAKCDDVTNFNMGQ